MPKLIRIAVASVLWLCASVLLCCVIETTQVGAFGFVRGVSIVALAVFALAAVTSEWDHANAFWWMATLSAVVFVCALLHPLMRLEATFGSFLPPARDYLTRHDREVFMQYHLAGGSVLGGVLAVFFTLAMVAVIAGLLVFCVRKSTAGYHTQLAVDRATIGPHSHERLCELALGDDEEIAREAVSRLDYVRDRGTLKEAARLHPSLVGMSFLLTLPYPEEADFIREQLTRHPDYALYDPSCGWPHTHVFTEVSQTSEDSSQTVVDESCPCGMHRITRTTFTQAEKCPQCGKEIQLQWNGSILKTWDFPPKPWYGYDAYTDPDMYTGGWTCAQCGCYLEPHPGFDFELIHEESKTTYEWRG